MPNLTKIIGPISHDERINYIINHRQHAVRRALCVLGLSSLLYYDADKILKYFDDIDRTNLPLIKRLSEAILSRLPNPGQKFLKDENDRNLKSQYEWFNRNNGHVLQYAYDSRYDCLSIDGFVIINNDIVFVDYKNKGSGRLYCGDRLFIPREKLEMHRHLRLVLGPCKFMLVYKFEEDTAGYKTGDEVYVDTDMIANLPPSEQVMRPHGPLFDEGLMVPIGYFKLWSSGS